MGNQLAPKMPEIQLTAGNVVVVVHGMHSDTFAKSNSDTSYNKLIRGRIVRVGPPISGGASDTGDEHTNLNVGDEVWVRARKGYPLNDEGDGQKLFVFNQWDVAAKLTVPDKYCAGYVMPSKGY